MGVEWPDPQPWPSPPPPPSPKPAWPRVVVALVAAALGALLVIPVLALLRGDLDPSTRAGNTAIESATPAATAEAAELATGVVDIATNLGFDRSRGAGSGMVISPTGTVLTSAHVIRGATAITVTVVATGESYQATVLGSDATRDVALLRLEGASGLDAVTLGDSAVVAQGDAVIAVGNAGGTGGSPSVSTGTVTALDQTITVTDPDSGRRARLDGLIETDASLEPGDSGGPMYNASGEVIGISTAADAGRSFPGAEAQSYAVAIDTAEAIAEEISAGRGSSTIQIGIRGFLGVQVDGDSGESIRGALIALVLDGTPAEAAGLHSGDVIIAIDDNPVDSGDGLTDALHGHHPGDEVRVFWTDAAGRDHDATVTLAEGPV